MLSWQPLCIVDHVASYQRVSDTDDGFITVSFTDAERAEQEEFNVLLKKVYHIINLVLILVIIIGV